MKCQIEKSLGCIITVLLVKNVLFTLPFFLTLRTIINTISIVVIFLLFLYSISKIFQRNGRTVLVVFFAGILYSLFQLLLFPNNTDYYISDLLQIILYGAIPFLFAISVTDYSFMLSILRKCAYIIVIVASICVIVLYSIGKLHTEYSMAFGSSVVVGVVILEFYALIEKKWYDIIFFFIGLICILLSGSRGPLLGIICYFVLHIILINKYDNFKSIIWNIFIIGAGITLYLYYTQILNALNQFFIRLGIQSRTLLLFIDGRINQDSGRAVINELSKKLINENWLTGIGYDGLQGLGYANLTPHNTFLEFLLYNGFFIGGILIIVLSIIWLRGIIKYRGSYINYLCIIFFSLYVPRSFIGAGGIEKIDFWLLLAFSILSIRYKNLRNTKDISAVQHYYDHRSIV